MSLGTNLEESTDHELGVAPTCSADLCYAYDRSGNNARVHGTGGLCPSCLADRAINTLENVLGAVSCKAELRLTEEQVDYLDELLSAADSKTLAGLIEDRLIKSRAAARKVVGALPDLSEALAHVVTL